MSPSDLWVLATAIACAVPCALLGCFLVLRRMSLLGDAITHAVLPGLAIAFALTSSRAPGAMLAGAAVMGVVTAVASAGLNRWGKVDEGAALGSVFTVMFAIGVILVNVYARNVDLDPGCVLYGAIEYAPLNTVDFLGVEWPRALVTLGAVGAVVAALVCVFFKELKIVCFDSALATTLGISAGVVHYGLMGAVAATSVASFEAVGSVLVVAMLVAPAATAQLLTDRLSTMLWVASGVAVLDAGCGWGLAIWLNTSVAGMMAAVSGAVFVLAMLGAPRHGVLAKAIRTVALRVRIAEEDLLGSLYRHSEGGAAEVRQGGVVMRTAAWRLARKQAVRRDGTQLVLTDYGMQAARSIIRSHRLWETYLAQHTDLPLDHLHAPSERLEHFISGAMQEELAREAGALQDPHGKRIPDIKQ